MAPQDRWLQTRSPSTTEEGGAHRRGGQEKRYDLRAPAQEDSSVRETSTCPDARAHIAAVAQAAALKTGILPPPSILHLPQPSPGRKGRCETTPQPCTRNSPVPRPTWPSSSRKEFSQQTRAEEERLVSPLRRGAADHPPGQGNV